MSSSPTWAYMFEASSIQSYLVLGGRLADMVAASELVEQLTCDLLDDILKTLDLEEDKSIRFSRRAGGAFFAFLPERQRAEDLRNLMALTLAQIAPGLDFVHCVVEGENDFDAASKGMETLGRAKAVPRASLPVIGPLVMRAPRTGNAAVENMHMAGNTREFTDAPLRARRLFDKSRYAKGKLVSRFAPKDGTANNLRWPTNLQGEQDSGEGSNSRAFPFKGEDKTLAILHVDGNGLGQMLIQLKNHVQQAPANYVGIYRAFSDCLKDTTEEAAQVATGKVLLSEAVLATGTVPARPLILGGDDLTIILRADLGIDFAQEFLIAFETASEKHLQSYKATLVKKYNAKALADKLPNMLTACGGMVLQKASQPFSLGHELAAGLCDHAKECSRKAQKAQREKGQANAPMPSSLAFHRLISTWSADRDDIESREYQVRHAKGVINLSLGAYRVGKVGGDLPELAQLLKVKALLDKPNHFLGINGVRQLATEAHLGAPALDKFERRIKELLASKKLLTDPKGPYVKLQEQLKALYGTQEKLACLLFHKGEEDQKTYLKAPVVDLLCLAKGGASHAEL